MPNYIETRPEAIKAIHRSITDKWNPIFMGCATWGNNAKCGLCLYTESDNYLDCPLYLTGDGCLKDDRSDTYSIWDKSLQGEGINSSPAEAEAILEALVMLLPESERAVYGG